MSLAVGDYFFLEKIIFPYLADSLGFDRWNSCLNNSILLPLNETHTHERIARKESKRKSRNTTHAKSKIQKVVFLVERIFRATLEKRKTDTSCV